MQQQDTAYWLMSKPNTQAKNWHFSAQLATSESTFPFTGITKLNQLKLEVTQKPVLRVGDFART